MVKTRPDDARETYVSGNRQRLSSIVLRDAGTRGVETMLHRDIEATTVFGFIQWRRRWRQSY